jgi:hypothetical protein
MRLVDVVLFFVLVGQTARRTHEVEQDSYCYRCYCCDMPSIRSRGRDGTVRYTPPVYGRVWRSALIQDVSASRRIVQRLMKMCRRVSASRVATMSQLVVPW